MEYIVLAGIVIATIAFYKLKLFFIKAKDSSMVKEDHVLSNKADSLKKDIEELNKKIDNAYHPDMTPEEIVEFWRGKK